VLFGFVMTAISTAGLAVFAMGASRVTVNPAVSLWVVRIAILVSTALFLGLIGWGGLAGIG
jgi:hypothetical protein